MEKKGILGFDTFNDLGLYFTKYLDSKLTIFLSVIAAFTGFIENFVWTSAAPVYCLYFLYLMDFATGIMAAIKEKNFTSYKIPRVLLGMVGGTILLAVSHQASSHSLFFIALPSIVLAILYSQNLISIVENLARLEVLNKNAVDFLKSKINLKELFKKKQ